MQLNLSRTSTEIAVQSGWSCKQLWYSRVHKHRRRIFNRPCFFARNGIRFLLYDSSLWQNVLIFFLEKRIGTDTQKYPKIYGNLPNQSKWIGREELHCSKQVQWMRWFFLKIVAILDLFGRIKKKNLCSWVIRWGKSRCWKVKKNSTRKDQTKITLHRQVVSIELMLKYHSSVSMIIHIL